MAILAALGLALAAPSVATANPRGLGHMALAGTDYASASGDIPRGHQITGLWIQVNSRIRHGNSFTIDTATVVNFDYIVTCTSPGGNISQRSGSGSASEMLKPSDLFRYHNRYSIPGPFRGAATCNLSVTANLAAGSHANISIGYSDSTPRLTDPRLTVAHRKLLGGAAWLRVCKSTNTCKQAMRETLDGTIAAVDRITQIRKSNTEYVCLLALTSTNGPSDRVITGMDAWVKHKSLAQARLIHGLTVGYAKAVQVVLDSC
jgi:hypothetical protein